MLIEKMNGIAHSFIGKAIFALLPLSFLIGGMSGYLYSSDDTFAAKVNGEVISQQDFMNRYNQEFETRAQQEGDQFLALSDSPQFVTAMRQGILNQMVDQELLRQYAVELKLNVTDDMIKRAIVEEKAFQVDGKFNNERYLQALRQNGISPDGYAAMLRGGLILQQMQNGIAGSELVLPVQAENAAALLMQQRVARTAVFALAPAMAAQQVSSEEVQAYYDANKQNFVQPEQLKVQYFAVSGADVAKTIEISDTQIAQYYQEHKGQFTSQKLAHIQLANEQEADSVYQQLQNGGDFAELAKTHSTDKLSGAKGGDLGWVKEGELPKDFEGAALLLDVGKYSTPVNVDGAYHIILVADRQQKTLADLKEQITAELRKTLLADRFTAIQNEVSEKANSNEGSLEAAAQAAGVKVQETAYFTRQDVPAALNFPNVTSALFDSDLANGGNSEPLTTGDDAFVMFRVVDHKAEGVQSFDEAKANVETFLKRQKAEQQLTTQAEAALKGLNEGNANALPAGVSFGAQQTFSLAQPQDPVLTSGVFALAKPQADKANYQIARDSQGNVVIVALESVTDGKLSADELVQFSGQLLQTQQLGLQDTLMQALRNRASIEVNETFINQEDEN